MRFGWKLSPGDLRDEACAAESLGYEVVWIDGDTDLDPTIMAATLASDTVGIRVGITEEVGDVHPVELAEQVAVADLVLGGRIVLAVRAASGDEDRLPEVLDLLLESFASHPFRHDGPVWPTPANLEQNVFSLEDRIRVTPAPAQLELPVWVAGRVGRSSAFERGLGIVADLDENTPTLTSEWEAAAASLGPLARRIRRSTVWRPRLTDDGGVDVVAALAALTTLQRNIGLDLVIVDTDAVDRSRVMTELTRFVRPRVQLDRLPPGLDEHWAALEHDDRRIAAAAPTTNSQQHRPGTQNPEERQHG